VKEVASAHFLGQSTDDELIQARTIQHGKMSCLPVQAAGKPQSESPSELSVIGRRRDFLVHLKSSLDPRFGCSFQALISFSGALTLCHAPWKLQKLCSESTAFLVGN
jgi:hypothetical protein